MRKQYDICSGRDLKGERWEVRVPVGVVEVGMYVRLVGGTFLRVERVERSRRIAENAAVAAEVLAPVWGCGC